MWEKNIDSFKPSYVWPNEAFGFRIYHDSPTLRIFIIENITHNWKWLKEYRHQFRDNDHFIVSLGWYFGEFLVQECNHVFEILNLNKSNFHIMFNDFSDKSMFEKYGFKGELINQNCFLDENLFKIIDSEKIYDAIYTARLVDFKRHHLANKIDNLALIAGPTHGPAPINVPPNRYKNEQILTPEEVMQKLSESKVGIILSEAEGACYSSSEYLLCGLPVVSTNSYGGRSVWYNSSNSLICDATPENVAEAVKKLANSYVDRRQIREMHINLANYFRGNFIKLHQELINRHGEKEDAKKFFYENFMHKLFNSDVPNFQKIFSV